MEAARLDICHQVRRHHHNQKPCRPTILLQTQESSDKCIIEADNGDDCVDGGRGGGDTITCCEARTPDTLDSRTSCKSPDIMVTATTPVEVLPLQSPPMEIISEQQVMCRAHTNTSEPTPLLHTMVRSRSQTPEEAAYGDLEVREQQVLAFSF